jgi:YHS domain-containing protein
MAHPNASSCCHAPAPTGHTDLLNTTASGDDLAECPVMKGSTVVKTQAEAAGLFRDYEGQRYWFCCAACGPLFDADPAKYVTAP